MMIFPLVTDVVGHLKSKKGKNTNFLGTSQIIRFQKLHRNFENQDNHNNVSLKFTVQKFTVRMKKINSTYAVFFLYKAMHCLHDQASS